MYDWIQHNSAGKRGPSGCEVCVYESKRFLGRQAMSGKFFDKHVSCYSIH